MKLWVAWARGRFVRRSVKSSAILPAAVGGSAIFRWETCSLSARAREGVRRRGYLRKRRPLILYLCGDPGRSTSLRHSQLAAHLLQKSPSTYPDWPDPGPSGPRTGWVQRTSRSCLGGWLQTDCSRYLRKGQQVKGPHCCAAEPSLSLAEAYGEPSSPSRKQMRDSGSCFTSRPMKNSEPKSSEGMKAPYLGKPTS